MKKPVKNVLIGVTASIAAYKSCDIIRSLRKLGYETKVVMSPDAGYFITPLTLQAISCSEVVTDMFKVSEKWDIYHISLAEWADVILIAPATADMISKLACGLADCALSAVVLASKADVLIAPAMNENMYTHKAVQENIEKLKRYGYKFVAPKRGYLACGYEGMGHIADTSDIIKAVQKSLGQ
ncbi:MAG: bifunctional phosphopantothenoylcysteine decarboxylase/phosphopantothenate--cysteine ligase CoaBC [Candidatus Omnitrophota bacterium]|nr:bifunctional phosphopantothenoylcysteine decarboxylase/phosphopantothenate--cysteine ligase CoaBC [Candidatus Omnitrophota bacterium]